MAENVTSHVNQAALCSADTGYVFHRPHGGFLEFSSVIPVEFWHGLWTCATTASLPDFRKHHILLHLILYNLCI
jgi:hypothetical protein